MIFSSKKENIDNREDGLWLFISVYFSFILFVCPQCRILAAASLPGTRFKHLVRVPNFLHLHRLLKEFESKESWVLDIWEWPRFWILFYKRCICSVEQE